MISADQQTKRIMSGALLGVMLFGIVLTGLFSFSGIVHAQSFTTPNTIAAAAASRGACFQGGGTIGGPCPGVGIQESLDTVEEKIIAPMLRILLLQALLNVVQFVLDRLAYEAAVAIASGGIGEDSLFYAKTPAEAFGELGLDMAGEALGQLNDITNGYLGIGFDLCAPGPLLNFALAIGIKQKYQPEDPSCDILEVGKNWESYISNTFQTITDPDTRNAAIKKKFAESLKPGKNELSASLRLNVAVDHQVHEAKITNFFERTEKPYKDVTNFITGDIETPSQTLQAEFEKKVIDDKGKEQDISVNNAIENSDLIAGIFVSTASTFVNTLLSTLLQKLYDGLFAVDPPEINLNVDDYEGAGGSGGREGAESRFASLLTSNPIATSSFDALAEFVVCTASGVVNRGLNNCVMDVNFLAAVSRGSTAVALTVQEAIDEGLLEGGWAIISPEDKPSNQDDFCYTYGYCYGNLVKLRKARVIPVGWELAALRNDTTNPATLQEIIDGFEDCTDLGTVGSANSDNDSSKWCHLIDPNWVLKYPESQCRAIVNGEIRIGSLINGRYNTCADAPSCIGEDNEGQCSDGFGYCMRERNIWRFRGEECPEEYATCLDLENTFSGSSSGYLLNTVEFSVCDQDNAGCMWYRTNKYYSDAGTEDDTEDDTFEWLPAGVDYVTIDREDAWQFDTGSGASARETFGEYTSRDDYESGTEASVFSHEDRIYFTHDITECDEEDGGCTQLYGIDSDMILNIIQNPSFEDDDDLDGFPDAWDDLGSTSYELDTEGDSFYGNNASVANNAYFQQYVSLTPNNFYTMSFYVRADDATAAVGSVGLDVVDDVGVSVNLLGTSFAGDCEDTDLEFGVYTFTLDPSDTDTLPTGEWTRFECTFTTTQDVAQVIVSVSSPGELRFDAFQLELGEDANIFTTGYSSKPPPSYYKIAPGYLGCSGAETDPEECDGYAQMCSAQDVGCSLYTPEDGDPPVPAIISELDECPSECVGYTTYKQEATSYDDEDFPLYFIAESASVCTEQYVGCDAFTNLSSVEEGGETVEYYTQLRACLTEDMADDSASNKTPATFFTWEGSDNEGYQLQTWSLLESNLGSAVTITYTQDEDGDGVADADADQFADLAPCVEWQVSTENEVVCSEDTTTVGELEGNDDCNEHDDIFDNPDCREFFDTEGNIHYREYSLTISVDDECTAYRKDESSQTDCDASGGFWTAAGFCRYFSLPSDATECPAAQAGCRLFTGGAGRNATTILNENFEGGTYEDFEDANLAVAPGLSISNESVATDGHSLRITASGGFGGVATLHEFLNGTDDSVSFDADDSTVAAATCTTYGHYLNESESGCLVDLDGDLEGDDECTFGDGDAGCGSIYDSLTAGKTLVVEFWAKGSSDLVVGMIEDGGAGTIHDFVDTSNIASTITDMETITLGGSWEVYTLGPLDTSGMDDFDENAVLVFALDGTSGDEEAYIDNITLKQVEENIAIIKDSWVVPSTCDTSPTGVESNQYYLGCEAYTDHKGNDVDLYQFSAICEEEVIGCEAFYNTYNSDSAYQEVFNARCVYSTDIDLDDGETAESNIDCGIDGQYYCTITVGRSYCTFDVEKVLADPLPLEDSGEDTSSGADIYFGVVYGPETVVVSADQPVYIVAEDEFECAESGMGCQEVGVPTFNQDQSEVDEFESAYYINLPSDYGNILCEDEALFCEEWEHGETGNWYFKDPYDKTCEYKTSITIDSQTYYGWFRSGISEPCYFEDDDEDGAWDVNSEQAYLIAGEEFGMWRNGDVDATLLAGGYVGWVAECGSQYDMCTEFIDVVDTGGGLNEDGQSYFFTNDELLDENNLSATQRCEGQVSQKFGCAVLNNTTDSDARYNASASYVVSIHADIFYNETPNALVDPVDCELEEGGVFELSTANQADLDIDEDTVDLCARRCLYTVESGDAIETSMAVVGAVSTEYYERSCLVDSDCPDLKTRLGETSEATCSNVSSDSYDLNNDANTVMKVNRDRTCAAWLACQSSRTSWNTSTSKYETICGSIDLCVEGTQQGDRASCTKWSDSDPVILTDFLYSKRDVNWTGSEYSGLSIPNQLPVEHYDQFNLNPSKTCVDSSGNPLVNDNGYDYSCSTAEQCPNTTSGCSVDSECTTSEFCNQDDGVCYYACTDEDIETDYRLVYNAGPCDSSEEDGVGEGGSCAVGYCQSSPSDQCSQNDDCPDEDCVIGFCQAAGTTGYDDDSNPSCSSDPDCAGVVDDANVPTLKCDTLQSICVDVLTSDEDLREACVVRSDCSGSSEQKCITSSATSAGSCFQNRCLTNIRDLDGDGIADDINTNELLVEECRGYPELTSPFPKKVVEDWRVFAKDEDDDGNIDDAVDYGFTPVGTDGDGNPEDHTDPWSTPYNYVSGYQDATVCAPDEDGNPTDACLCSYDKVEYGGGSIYRYYELGSTSGGLVLPGICASGDKKDWPCGDDSECDGSTEGTGSCIRASRTDSLYGWPGYCIEKDTSIQLNNSADVEDQACLTWLPVDQLSGATDLYGKYTEAGFPLTNTYYCAETAFYADLWPMGVVLDSGTGAPSNMTYACATSETGWLSNCHNGEYNSCQKYAWCPKGWIALVSYCDSSYSDQSDEDDDVGDDAGTTCKQPATSSADVQKDSYFIAAAPGNKDHCPYVCIPENSYHAEGDDKGQSCDFDIENEWGEPHVTGNLKGAPGAGDEDDVTGTNVFETKWLSVGQGDDWNDGGSGNGSESIKEKFNDCVVRGVPYEMGNDPYDPYDLTWYTEYDEITEYGFGVIYAGIVDSSTEALGAYGLTHRPLGGMMRRCSNVGRVCSTDNDCSFTDLAAFCAEVCWPYQFIPVVGPICTTVCLLTGLSDLIGTCDELTVGSGNVPDTASFAPYLGCQEIVQAATGDPLNGNKAWTNRLWSQYDSNGDGVADPYATEDPDGTFTETEYTFGEFDYTVTDTPDPAGSILFSEHYSGGDDVNDYWVINEWGEKDSWPLPVETCDTNPDNAGNTGLSTVPWGDASSCAGGVWQYPRSSQYLDDVANSTNSMLVGTPYALGSSYENIDEVDEYEDDNDIFNDTANGDFAAFDRTLLYYGNSCKFGDNCTTDIVANQTSVTGLLSQLFAKVYRKFRYDWDYDSNDTYDPDTDDFYPDDDYGANSDGGGHGAYKLVDVDLGFDVSGGEDFDISVEIDSFGSGPDAFPDDDERAPVIVSVGECIGTSCYEGTEGAFSINEVDQGTIVGAGQKHIDLSFYIYAAPNQLPLRNIIVDYGDDFNGFNGQGDPDWPTGSQSGSTAADNFYKNHRGLNAGGNENCVENNEWGKTNQSCSASYVAFGHDYTCTQGRVNTLEENDRLCVVDEFGNLTISPCTGNGGTSLDNITGAVGACVFQPRVFAIDNWEWCTGFCDSNSQDDSDACYGADAECQYDKCPSGGYAGYSSCPDQTVSNSTSNPWVNFNGYVVVDPE